MSDVVFIVAALGFLAICWLYVRGCERIVASDEEAGPGEARR